jgi:hypothetical protein
MNKRIKLKLIAMIALSVSLNVSADNTACLGIIRLAGTLQAIIKDCNYHINNDAFVMASTDCWNTTDIDTRHFYLTNGEDIFYSDKGRNGLKSACKSSITGLKEYLVK